MKGNPVQYVSDYSYYRLNIFDLSLINNDRLFHEIEEYLVETPFSLFDSDLLYLAYFKLPGGEAAIFLKFHHIIADAWSLILIADNILKYYLYLKNNERIDDEELVPSYLNYITAEKKYLDSEQFLKDKVYWDQKVKLVSEFTNLKNRNRYPQNSTNAKRESFLITGKINEKIHYYCKDRRISIFVLFVAIFTILIYRITSKKDIMLGTTVLNRSNYNDKRTIGMFINTIPIRLQIDPSLDFDSYVYYVGSEWRNILRHQRYPINFNIKEYHRQNQTIGSIFDITINYQNAMLTSFVGLKRVEAKWHSCGHQTYSLNIHINHREKEDQYLIDFDYLVELFTAEEIKELYQRLLNILEDGINHPHKPLKELELLSGREKEQLIHDFNRTSKTYPSRNIIQLFERQVQKNPEYTALIYEGQRMTYGELNQKANQMAWMLMSKGVKANSIVGLLVKRSFEMIIGILAILKAGGAYLPIDPAFPRKRIKEILEDSNCMALLTDKFIIGQTTWKGEIISLNRLANLGASTNPNYRHAPQDLAYLIYTSGSSGKPKGVLIEHHSIANTVQWRTEYYGFNCKDVLLQIPPYNFDSSVEDIFSFLSVGAAIVLIDQEKRLDLNYLKELITKHRVTHFLATPLLYSAILDQIAPELVELSSITLAGENVPLNMVKKHFSILPQVKLYNEYGPTENSVCSTVYQFSAADEEVLIGKPISNCRCYVLNQDLYPQPVGVPGELYLAGEGLARGYLNNPELTEAKFIVAPTINERCYKTGDLVKWKPDGNLQFIERIDNQVKIRGFRIELGEIEHHLLKHPAVKEAVAVVDERDPNHKYICAYIVPDREVSIAELKEYLAKSLPDYMIPTFFLFLERLPLTPNGKIDKESLPAPERNSKAGRGQPENEVEAKLVKVWQEVLEVAQVGTNDNFFELGGDSLAIIRILTMLYGENCSLTVRDFYLYPTIRELADRIITQRQQELAAKEDQTVTVSRTKSHPKQPVKSIKFRQPRKVKNLLLTGATGFLGSHILFELLQLEGVRIYALTRGITEKDARMRLFDNLKFYFPQLDEGLLKQRLTVVNGDLTMERFGMLESEYQELRQRIDSVIHTAALVKHYGKYQDFHRVNVLGVQNILEFSQGKYLMHISTTSVAGAYARQSRKELYFDETCLDMGQDLADNYYVQTKFEAEKLVLERLKNGLNGTVLRVGNLTGRYTDGVFQRNIKDNKFYQIIKSFTELALVPNSLTKTTLEFTPVDLCSLAVVKLLQMEESGGHTFHLFNHNHLTIKDFVAILQNLGYKINLIQNELFHERIRELSKNQSNFESLFGIIPDLKMGKLEYHSSVVVDSRFSVKALEEVNFAWPEIDENYLRKVFNYLYSVRFIKKGMKQHRKVL